MFNEDNLRSIEAFADETERSRLIKTLVDLRQQQGLSQATVARRMGIAQPTVSEFESQGQEGRDSSISLIQRYARAIGVELRMWIEPNKPELVEPPIGKTEGSGEESTA
jgi:transcriptional regulator with XRE-family HTH domain